MIAQRTGAVVVFPGLDLATGRRTLEVLGVHAADAPGLLQHIASHWQRLLCERSWGFMLWSFMPSWFDTPLQVTQAAQAAPG